VNPRAFLSLAALSAGLLLLPWFANNYLLALATLFLFRAYTGQAWNVMMGFAGQLSLGHALYLGLGAYSAAALYFHFGIGPWAGIGLSILLCILVAVAIGALAFRYGISGVYFTLLTIAFTEFARIAFDHFDWVGASGGLFLPVGRRNQLDLPNLRGPPAMFYYFMLTLTATGFALSAWLLRRRAGYYWQAIRENESAAEALGVHTFRWKLLAIAASAAMMAPAGVFHAFYFNNLFPEHIFSIGRSIEILLGPIIGGIGTLCGPIVGAAVLTLFADGATELVTILGWDLPGVKQLIYGALLFLAIVGLPHGIWPALARRLGIKS